MADLENVAPEPGIFCPERELAAPPQLRLLGGVRMQPIIDPTKGIAGDCSFSVDLAKQASIALAPLQPFFTIIDGVGTLMQIVIVAIEVIQNPFKVGKLLALVPGLTEKFNKLLELIPISPAGVLAFFQMVADIIGIARFAVSCAVSALQSVQREISMITEQLDALQTVDDEDIRAKTTEILECSRAQAVERAATIGASLSTVAKLMCTAKVLVSLIPGGAAIAQDEGFAIPDVSGLVRGSDPAAGLALAIESLEDVRDVLEALQEAVAAIASAGLSLIPPPFTFTCDVAPAEENPPEPTEPTLSIVYLATDLPTLIVGPIATAPAPADVGLLLYGTNFDATSKVFFGTNEVPKDNVSLRGSTQILATIPANFMTQPGTFQVSVANSTADTAPLFSNVTESQAARFTKVSDPFEVEVD